MRRQQSGRSAGPRRRPVASSVEPALEIDRRRRACGHEGAVAVEGQADRDRGRGGRTARSRERPRRPSARRATGRPVASRPARRRRPRDPADSARRRRSRSRPARSRGRARADLLAGGGQAPAGRGRSKSRKGDPTHDDVDRHRRVSASCGLAGHVAVEDPRRHLDRRDERMQSEGLDGESPRSR